MTAQLHVPACLLLAGMALGRCSDLDTERVTGVASSATARSPASEVDAAAPAGVVTAVVTLPGSRGGRKSVVQSRGASLAPATELAALTSRASGKAGPIQSATQPLRGVLRGRGF
jgi:hypothetical protein